MTARSVSAFNGYRFPDDIIALAVRWYLRFGLVVVTEHYSSLSPWYPGHEGPVSVLSPSLSHLMREDYDAGQDLRAVPALGTTRQKGWYRT